MRILITGAKGFIGIALCSQLPSDGNTIVGVDITKGPDKSANIVREQADLTDWDSVAEICEKYSPDVVIHCAGIAHQKIGAIDSAAYMRVNSEATENLAKCASTTNPDVSFIFLSSVSVYGEGPQITRITRINGRKKAQNIRESGERRLETGDGRREDGECWPSSDYAVSKLDAESRLIALFDADIIRNLTILRLSPVYDREWSLNLDRRVFAPRKLSYLRFGSGLQKMSALARPNLVDFIAHLIGENWPPQYGLPDLPRYHFPKLRGRRGRQTHTDAHRKTGRIKETNTGVNILNVCDAEAYEFNRIIEVFKESGIRPWRPVISVPLSFVWLATRLAGAFFPDKKSWFHSCYDKLASDLVFDNEKMLSTGFRARHSLETIYFPNSRKKAQEAQKVP